MVEKQREAESMVQKTEQQFAQRAEQLWPGREHDRRVAIPRAAYTSLRRNSGFNDLQAAETVRIAMGKRDYNESLDLHHQIGDNAVNMLREEFGYLRSHIDKDPEATFRNFRVEAQHVGPESRGGREMFAFQFELETMAGGRTVYSVRGPFEIPSNLFESGTERTVRSTNNEAMAALEHAIEEASNPRSGGSITIIGAGPEDALVALRKAATSRNGVKIGYLGQV